MYYTDWAAFWSSIARYTGFMLIWFAFVLSAALVIDIRKGKEENDRGNRGVLVIYAFIAVSGLLIALFLPPQAEKAYYAIDEARYLYSIGATQAELDSQHYRPAPGQDCVPIGGWSISTQAVPTNLDRAKIYLLNLGEYQKYRELGWAFVLDEGELTSVPVWRVLEIEAVCPP